MKKEHSINIDLNSMKKVVTTEIVFESEKEILSDLAEAKSLLIQKKEDFKLIQKDINLLENEIKDFELFISKNKDKFIKDEQIINGVQNDNS